jgi:hypothetical protein
VLLHTEDVGGDGDKADEVPVKVLGCGKEVGDRAEVAG